MKDCTTCKYGFVDEQLGFPMCHHPLRFSEDCVDFNMHEDIEEPEKATGIEEKKLPEGLEEAAIDFADNARKHLFTKDYAISSIADYDHGCIDGFIAGAEWQKEKDVAKFSSSLDKNIKHVVFSNYERGRNDMKKEMMEKAVEGRYMKANGKVYVESWPLDIEPDSVKAGDEVRLIIIPEE